MISKIFDSLEDAYKYADTRTPILDWLTKTENFSTRMIDADALIERYINPAVAVAAHHVSVNKTTSGVLMVRDKYFHIFDMIEELKMVGLTDKAREIKCAENE